MAWWCHWSFLSLCKTTVVFATARHVIFKGLNVRHRIHFRFPCHRQESFINDCFLLNTVSSLHSFLFFFLSVIIYFPLNSVQRFIMTPTVSSCEHKLFMKVTNSSFLIALPARHVHSFTPDFDGHNVNETPIVYHKLGRLSTELFSKFGGWLFEVFIWVPVNCRPVYQCYHQQSRFVTFRPPVLCPLDDMIFFQDVEEIGWLKKTLTAVLN